MFQCVQIACCVRRGELTSFSRSRVIMFSSNFYSTMSQTLILISAFSMGPVVVIQPWWCHVTLSMCRSLVIVHSVACLAENLRILKVHKVRLNINLMQSVWSVMRNTRAEESSTWLNTQRWESSTVGQSNSHSSGSVLCTESEYLF